MVDQIRHNNTRLSYVQLPLLLQMHHRPGKWDIYSLIGPSLGYGLHGKIKLRAEAGGQKKIIPFDLIFRKEPDDNPYDQVVYFNSESANRWDVAAQFGLGAGLPFGPGDLQLEARFGLGFVAFYKDEPSTFQKEQSQGKSRTLSVTVNYAISLGKN